ncbi:MAG TPA: helix-turn-helix domain-containing protein [Bryobacteraceae bacterium]|nr:helix-turn-helix domain-containing protein [Bryobacteraceae bacterium]
MKPSSPKQKTRPKRKKRKYDSAVRAESARATRDAIIDAARRFFLERGYAATTMPEIAQAAGTALDTVYATVGKKPALFRLLIEMAISGVDGAVPAEERDYVRAIRAEADPRRKLGLYAAAMGRIQPRLAPLIRVLPEAAALEPELRELWQSIAQRRANNMRLFVKDLAATGRLRSGISELDAADIVWSMNSPEFYLLLVEQRGWPVEKYSQWLADAWVRLLLGPR